MKTNLFNNYSAPEVKVVEVDLEGAILQSSVTGGNDSLQSMKPKNTDWD